MMVEKVLVKGKTFLVLILQGKVFITMLMDLMIQILNLDYNIKNFICLIYEYFLCYSFSLNSVIE